MQQPQFNDQVCVSMAPDCPHAEAPQAGPSSHADPRDSSSPLTSSRTSFSSATMYDRHDADHTHHNDFYRDQNSWPSASESSETLVGTLFNHHLASLKNKLPSVLAGKGYKKLASDEYPPFSRRIAHRKKFIYGLLLAAIFLGIGGRSLHRAYRAASKANAFCKTADPFCLSLHDDDSLQDASISIPTLPRPEHPVRPEDILPVDLHHKDTFKLAPYAPPLSATNRRQLDTIPSQRFMLDKPECVEAWVAHGEVCQALHGVYRQRPDLTSVDLLYSWVNGSDLRHSSAEWMHAYRPDGRWQEYVEQDLFPSESSSAGLSAPKHRRSLDKAAVDSRFRDHQELRFSMRSAVKHLQGLSTIHIVAPDFSAPYHLQPSASHPSKDDGARFRLFTLKQRRSTQPPFWLDVNKLKDAFLGLPSQLRRVQGLGTDRFTTDEGQMREGQVPQWLSLANTTDVLAGQEAATAVSTSSTSSPRVRLHHDWNAFRDNWLVTEALTADERTQRNDYRRAALPTFNSMAVEAMLGDQPGLHDNFVYSNDDFFFLDDVSSGDVSSPLFGPVLRLDPNLMVDGKQSPKAGTGEWPSLWHTNWLLDQRFGQRRRPYIQHVHKSFSKTLLQETRMGWAHEHSRVALNRFRNGGDNIVSHFLTYYNVIERHREALLWSFFMLKLDEDGDGLVSANELEQTMSQMGLTAEQSASTLAASAERSLTVPVRLTKRTTLKQDTANAALVQSGWPVPLKSRYVFSSQDGYPLAELSSQVIMRRRSEPQMERRVFNAEASKSAKEKRDLGNFYGWPDFVDERKSAPDNNWFNHRFERPACELDLDQCLVKPFAPLLQSGKLEWEQVFKQFAYADGACGDCLIHHLVGQSGQRGLGAFLPAAQRTFQGEMQESARFSNPVPHLPLTSVWNASLSETDAAFEAEQPCFSVSCVLASSGFGRGTPLRLFASQLIQRYAYTIADTPLKFERLETQYNSAETMQRLEQSMKRPSALERFANVVLKQQQQQGQTQGEPSKEAGAWVASQRSVDAERPAFACINDDITTRWVQDVGTEFTSWMGRMWPDKQRWEL
ncbi:hypothetical protein EX895_004873 [Sporisorium graminicola]|uniref:EF-hand domain-containing protein n=1 Tax=Sporisorium graminicola TaxID=280036 RepID=A0A4U7KS28_9BASI|nr:hypothetical protein EX895_004873 [Sporisorium graminicola]TKY86048.1 hypothetical protein EX895_004873 [Sporisorium graminicola]